MANNTISQVEINGTTYDLLDANTLSALDSLKTRVTTLESSVSQRKIVGGFVADEKAFIVRDSDSNRRVVFWDESGGLSYQKKVGNDWVTVWGK